MDKHLAEISRNAFLLILFLLTSLSVAVVVSYVLAPQYKSYISSKESYLQLKSAVENGRDYPLEMQQLQASISRLEQAMKEGEVQLPIQQFESHVISELQALAWKNSMALDGLRPAEGETIDHYRELLFDVQLSGQYFDLYRFLLDLKQMPGFLLIREMYVSPRPSSSATADLEVRMSLGSWRGEGQ